MEYQIRKYRLTVEITDRDKNDWEYMKSFFYHNSHLTYPYRIFSKEEWGYNFVM